jgi:hypothetical protein
MKERIIRAFAGTVILTSLLLAIFVHLNWLYVTAFVGLNLLQSSFTKFCPLDSMIDKLGIAKEKK